MRDLEAFRVIVWHNDAVNGTHPATLATGGTERNALAEFNKYLERPWHMRSFTPAHKVQLHGPNGLKMELT